MKKISNVLALLAVLLGDVMCAVVAYQYAAMQWGIRYAGYSAPAATALLYAIPYALALTACALAAHILRKAEKQAGK